MSAQVKRFGAASLALAVLMVLGYTLIVSNIGLTSVVGDNPTAADLPEKLQFKVMVSTFSAGQLTQAPSAQIEVTVNGQPYGTFASTAGGRLEWDIPSNVVTKWVLTVGDLAPRNFRAEVIDNYLKIYNENRGDKSVEYYEVGSYIYALEYYQDLLYLTNQGDLNAPIMSRVRAGERVSTPTGTSPVEAPVLKPKAALFTVYAAGHYAVYGGSIGFSDQTWPTNYWYNIDKYTEFTFLGNGEGTQSFPGQYLKYVITTPNTFQLDAVQFPSGAYLYDVIAVTTPDLSISFYGPPDGVYNTIGYDGLADRRGFTYSGFIQVDETTEGTPPPGGPEDDFGGVPPNTVIGGVVNNVGQLNTQSVNNNWNDFIGNLTGGSAGLNSLTGQAGVFTDNRVGAFSEGTDPVTGGSVDPQASGTPGVVFQWVYAGDKAPDELFLPIGEDGTFADGVNVQSIFDTVNDVPMFVLLRSFPAEFLLALTPGEHLLKYWLVDSAGGKSNERSETITINDPNAPPTTTTAG